MFQRYMQALILLLALTLNNFPVLAQSIDPQDQITTIFAPYDDAQGAYLRWLETARRSIRIAIYGFTNPAITDKLIGLHRNGVDVKLVMDRSQSSGRKEREQIARLEMAGIDLVIGQSRYHQLQHSKFTVIDDHLVESGSYNYSESANRQDNTLDFIDSPKRAALFLADWERVRQDMVAQGQ